MSRRKVLLVCGSATDERVWEPLIARFDGRPVSFTVVPWPHVTDRHPDVAEGVRNACADEQFDVTVGVGSSSSGAAVAATLARTSRLVLVDAIDAIEMAGGFRSGVDKVRRMIAGLPAAIVRMGKALEAGRTSDFAQMFAELVCADIGEEHTEVVAAMAADYAATMSSGFATAYRPWVDELAATGVPTTIVYDAARFDGPVGRFADGLRHRLPAVTIETAPVLQADYVGLRPDVFLADLLERVLRES